MVIGILSAYITKITRFVGRFYLFTRTTTSIKQIDDRLYDGKENSVSFMPEILIVSISFAYLVVSCILTFHKLFL
jgi:hypothetical protein